MTPEPASNAETRWMGLWVQRTVPMMITQPSLSAQHALIASLAADRFQKFRAATGGADRAATRLYLLDAEIASHLHFLLRFVEIALREHMHQALQKVFGERWFDVTFERFDLGTQEQFTAAQGRAGQGAPTGRIIAQVMLGTWLRLLSKGERLSDGRKARYHATIWEPALQAAFLGSSRSDVYRRVQTVNWARNRINHCEPVVFGFPQPGLAGPQHQLRKSPQRVLTEVRGLIQILSPELSRWSNDWNDLDGLLGDPLVEQALSLIEARRKTVLLR